MAEKFRASLVQELYNSLTVTTQMTHNTNDTQSYGHNEVDLYYHRSAAISVFENQVCYCIKFYTLLYSNVTGFKILRFIHD